MKRRHNHIDMTGFCAYFSHSAQVTRNARETLNLATEPGFSWAFAEVVAMWHQT